MYWCWILFVWYTVLWSQISRGSNYFTAGGFQDPEASLTENINPALSEKVRGRTSQTERGPHVPN